MGFGWICQGKSAVFLAGWIIFLKWAKKTLILLLFTDSLQSIVEVYNFFTVTNNYNIINFSFSLKVIKSKTKAAMVAMVFIALKFQFSTVSTDAVVKKNMLVLSGARCHYALLPLVSCGGFKSSSVTNLTLKT